jgi:Ner family transcriptional regulator
MSDQTDFHQVPGSGWHHEYVKAELRKRFGSLTAISKQLGVSRQSLSGALIDPLASTRLERRIAAALEVEPHKIWPTRWRQDGTPVPRSLRSTIIRPVRQKLNQRNV